MNEKEIISTLVLAIIQPSLSKADYLGLDISVEGLREVYAQITGFYERDKAKRDVVTFRLQGDTANNER